MKKESDPKCESTKSKDLKEDVDTSQFTHLQRLALYLFDCVEKDPPAPGVLFPLQFVVKNTHFKRKYPQWLLRMRLTPKSSLVRLDNMLREEYPTLWKPEDPDVIKQRVADETLKRKRKRGDEERRADMGIVMDYLNQVDLPMVTECVKKAMSADDQFAVMRAWGRNNGDIARVIGPQEEKFRFYLVFHCCC